MYQYSANQKENGDGSSTLYINKDRHVGHLYMSPCWMSCQPLAKRLNNKSWTVHQNIAIRREGHRKIQGRDLYLVQIMSQCRATSRKLRHRSLHVAIPNVAGDTSRATCRLSRLTEHIQHSVESPSMVDPQWNIWYWGSKWNLHTVCWSAVGCEWGTTSVYFGITYVCFIPSRLPVFAVEPQYLLQCFLFLSKVSFITHTKSSKNFMLV